MCKPVRDSTQKAQRVKNLPVNAGNVRDESGRSPGGGHGQPTPVFLPEESHGQRSLVGYSPGGRKESDMTERLQFTSLHKRHRETQMKIKRKQMKLKRKLQ